MMDGLKDKHRRAIIDILSASERVERAILFGSRAMGTFTPTSDVDIVLYGNELTPTDRSKLAAAIDELTMPQQVDLLLHKSIKKRELLEHIEKHGVEWWRRSWDMGIRWPEVAFGDVLLNGTRNGIYKKKEFHGSGVKIVNMGELFANPRLYSIPMKRVELTSKEKDKSCLQPGDLLFARRSLVAEGAGKCSIVMEVDEPTTFESSIIRARPDSNKLHSLFAYYLFNSPHGKYLLGTILRHVAVAGITGSDLVRLNVPLPPMSDQRSTAHILGSLDDKIELNRRMNQTLEAMARAIFKSWFVDFDPVHAKAEGRSTGLPDDIAALFPDSLEDSELGEIPKGWSLRSLYDSAEYINGAAYRNFHFTDEDGALPIVKIAELKNGITGQTKFTKRELDDKYRIRDGEILLSWSGNPDTSIGTFIWCGGPAWLNQHIFRVLPHLPIEKHFVFFLLKYLRPVFAEIARDKQTTGLGHFTARDMKRLIVVDPPESILTKFNDSVGPMFDRWYGNFFESNTLASLRDTLLPKLISGELRVPDAEKFVEEAGL